MEYVIRENYISVLDAPIECAEYIAEALVNDKGELTISSRNTAASAASEADACAENGGRLSAGAQAPIELVYELFRVMREAWRGRVFTAHPSDKRRMRIYQKFCRRHGVICHAAGESIVVEF